MCVTAIRGGKKKFLLSKDKSSFISTLMNTHCQVFYSMSETPKWHVIIVYLALLTDMCKLFLIISDYDSHGL